MGYTTGVALGVHHRLVDGEDHGIGVAVPARVVEQAGQPPTGGAGLIRELHGASEGRGDHPVAYLPKTADEATPCPEKLGLYARKTASSSSGTTTSSWL